MIFLTYAYNGKFFALNPALIESIHPGINGDAHIYISISETEYRYHVSESIETIIERIHDEEARQRLEATYIRRKPYSEVVGDLNRLHQKYLTYQAQFAQRGE